MYRIGKGGEYPRESDLDTRLQMGVIVSDMPDLSRYTGLCGLPVRGRGRERERA